VGNCRAGGDSVLADALSVGKASRAIRLRECHAMSRRIAATGVPDTKDLTAFLRISHESLWLNGQSTGVWLFDFFHVNIAKVV
jgi:hypothetical protein